MCHSRMNVLPNRIRFRELFGFGRRPATDRVFHTNVWFRGHNNPRYAQLLPRLGRVDNLLIVLSDVRWRRRAQFTIVRRLQPMVLPALARLAGRRYRAMLATNTAVVRRFGGPVVVDMDDPVFTRAELAVLRSPNVAAIVVTSDRIRQAYEEHGVTCPIEVVGQGIATVVDASRRRRSTSDDGTVVVGWIAPWLRLDGDPSAAEPLFNIQHLMDDLWPAISAACPQAQLRLIGRPGPRVRARAAGDPTVQLVGPLAQSAVPGALQALDLAVYHRRDPELRERIKITEFIASGVPIVAYDQPSTKVVEELGVGSLAHTSAEFIAAAVRLIDDADLRRTLADNAAAHAPAMSWDHLAEKYEAVLDRYLPV